MATVEDLLAIKGARVVSIEPDVTVLDATRKMNRWKIGSLVVTSDSGDEATGCERVIGMFTERDVLTRVVGAQLDPATTRVEEVMTRGVIFARRETDVDEIADMMRGRRIRHLPVCDAAEQLIGLISIGDLNAWRATGQATTIEHLNDYILGRA